MIIKEFHHCCINLCTSIASIYGVVHIWEHQHAAKTVLSLQCRQILDCICRVNVIIGCSIHYHKFRIPNILGKIGWCGNLITFFVLLRRGHKAFRINCIIQSPICYGCNCYSRLKWIVWRGYCHKCFITAVAPTGYSNSFRVNVRKGC